MMRCMLSGRSANAQGDDRPVASSAKARSHAAPADEIRNIPQWIANRRELRYKDQIVKRYRVPAPNQALVLAAFQEMLWPHSIDDPLPPVRDQDSKHRLQATVSR